MDLLFCEICDNPFSSKKTLAFHKKSHALDYKTPCPTCNKEFRKTYLKKHILNCFQIEEAQKEFHCQFCPKRFTEIQNLNRHLQIHDEMFENESCKLCPKTFPRKDSLNRHMKAVHEQVVGDEIVMVESKKCKL